MARDGAAGGGGKTSDLRNRGAQEFAGHRVALEAPERLTLQIRR